ncbi:separin [Empidonax traillii]|uniref:separin n=1 Tax=Empidonax traillii TaxID=164674 RepID=UPI000FFD3C9B|nr:separin [Empidonax traillii]
MDGKEERDGIEERLKKLRDSLRIPPGVPPPSRQQRLQTCDRVLRSCVEQLGREGPPSLGPPLVALAQEAARGYLSMVPNPPGLYMEKILFHLLKNAVNSCQSTGNSCWAAAELLWERLRTYAPLQDPPKDFTTVTYNAFCVLWKGAAALAGPDRPREEGRSLFSAQIRALRFLLLLERDRGSLPSLQPPFFTSQTAQKAAAASALYEAERAPCPVFLARQLREFLLETLCNEASNPPSIQHSLCFLELTLERSRHLCRAGRFHEALEALEEAKAFLGHSREDLRAPLVLLEAGIQLGKGRFPPGPLLCQAAAALRGEGSERTLGVLLEGARFVTSQLGEVTRRSRELPFSLEDLPGLCAFTEGHCRALQRLLGRVPPDALKQQVTVKQLLFRSLQLFSNTVHDTFQGSQPSGWLGLAQVSRSCTQSVTWMVEALEGLPETDRTKFLDVTASCTFKLGFAFQSQNFLEEAGTICEPFCRGVGELGGYGCPDTSPERLHKCFRVQVESWKRLGWLERALGSVTTWLLALAWPGRPLAQAGGVLGTEPGGLLHEPVGLWAKIKLEAAKQGQKELRLRTLKDSLEGHSLDKATLVSFLLAELQAYKCLKWDTGPERYNVLCDLLELCPEDPGGLLPRALGLLELAQVLCYHSFAPHTNCSALDAIQEALRLLEKVQRNSQNRDQLLDEKAQALLWLHICTLEAHMEKGMEREQRGRTQGSKNLEDFEPNDLNAEGRAGEEPDPWDGISCTLDTDRALTKSLDEAFSLWKQLLESPGIPRVRSLEQTVTSLHLLATLYKLLAKPIQALESFLLLQSLCRSLGDIPGTAWALSHLTRLLLQLECPTHAQVFLEELESILREFPRGDESQQLLQHSCLLLRSHLCCVSQNVEEGLSLLLQVVQSPLAQKATKGWYLLQAQGLQVVAMYLGMAPAHLGPELRHRLHQKGWKTPKVALMEVQKLLRSVIIFLLGFDILGGSRNNEGGEQFQDYGANVVLKWEVLGEALWCCERLVMLLGWAEVLCRARAFCGEALRVSRLLQGTRWCTSFLLLKSQLELQQGELELSQLNLQHTLFLLQPHPEPKPPQEPLLPPKIHLRKGHMEPRRRWDHPKNAPGEDDEGFLKGPALEFVAPSNSQDPLGALTASPELKPMRKINLAFLSHPWSCPCCRCSDLVVSVLGLRWALAQSRGQVLAGEGAAGVALVRRVLPRCARVGQRFARELGDRLGGHHGEGEPPRDRNHPRNQDIPGNGDPPGTGDPTRHGHPLGYWDLGLQDPHEDQDPAENWDLPTLEPQNPPKTRPQPTLGLLDELVAMGYCTLALQSLSSPGGLWDPQDKELEWGLAFLGSCSPHLPGLGVSRATLLLAKATATLGYMATKLGDVQRKKEQETPQKGALEEKTKQGPPSQGVLGGLNPLRAVEEEEEEELRHSFEALQVSQEWEGPPGRVQPKGEVKAGVDVLGRGDLLPGFGGPLPMAGGPPSLDSVLGLLQEALGWISHFPPGSLYGGLCQLLALLMGDRDPLGTAGLLSESLCVTARHQLLSILHSRARKKRKKEKLAGDVSEQLQGLSLQEGGDPPQPCPRLAQLEELFQFSSSGLGAPEREQFQEQIQQIPSGVTVVLLALGSPCPGALGDTLLLTRLERDMEPLIIRIPTHRSQAPLSSILREFELIQCEQKEANGCTDKQEWWSRRSRLDQRMKTLIQSLESHVLGCWRGLLLPRSPRSSPSLAEESSRLIPELRSCGWNEPNPTLVQVLLNGAPALTPPDVQALAFGLCPARPLRARLILEEALEGALERGQGDRVGSLVLLLDKHLQRLPWESLPALGAVPVTRLPALRFLLSYVMAQQSSGSVLARGVNPKSTFYVLNPHNNLGGTEQRFRAWFESEPGWHGVSGSIPTPEQIQEALLEHDLYIYAGHGSGVRLLDRQTLSRLECRAVVLLFGCSSAAMALKGGLEPTGTVLRYIMAGCPLVLGTLWDVTDRDLDRFAQALLQGWLRGGPGTPLLPHLAQARQAPRLKSLIGAAPVAYGLPVSLS